MSLGVQETAGQERETDTLLCVDLDGTLLATDALWESLIVLLKARPWNLLLLPAWILRGKARFKREIASRTRLDPAPLPYREDVLEFLRQERRTGREIVLATASDQIIAVGIAEHLGLFTHVLASDGVVNLSGANKLQAVLAHAAGKGFDYVGNSTADLALWEHAEHALLVSPSARLLERASRLAPVKQVFSIERRRVSDLRRALRVHQWVKNVLVFVPMVVAHRIFDLETVLSSLYAFLAFSLCASSAYIVNDLLDLESDRQHPYKRTRPFASGAFEIRTGVLMAPALLAASLLIAALLLPPLFLVELLLYFALTLAYSLWLKRVVILDVLVLASLYTIRVLAGDAATNIPVSPWLLAFSMFLFLSLALVKRYSELRLVETMNREGDKGRDYVVSDMELWRSVGPSAGYLSVLVLALYIHSLEVTVLYSTPIVLWLIGPCMLYWITRMWLLAHRGLMEGDPIVFTAKDPVSYAVGSLILLIIVAASLP